MTVAALAPEPTAEWAPTIEGRPIGYGNPSFTAHDLWNNIATGLSHLSRYGGQTSTPYTVAQHSVLIAEAIEDETGDMELAAFGLLHDAHETPFGEFPSPAKNAIADEMIAGILAQGMNRQIAEGAAQHYRNALARLTSRLDRAICEAARLDFERFRARHDEVKLYDLRALETERRHLCRWPPSHRWAIDAMNLELLPLRASFKIWSAGCACERFVAALDHFLPRAARAAARF